MAVFIAILKAFLIGGAICVVGQLLIDLTKITPGKVLVGFVVAGVVLGALGVYQPLMEFANCGASIPLTGFGAALVKGTNEAIREKGLLGVLYGPLSSGAVGIMAAIIGGVIVSIFAKPKQK